MMGMEATTSIPRFFVRPRKWEEVKEMKMIEGQLAPIYLTMLALSKQVKYNPYDIGDHPGPVSEMKIDLDVFMRASV